MRRPGRPVPTARAVWLLALGVPGGVLAAVHPWWWTAMLAYDALLLGLVLLDHLLAPGADALQVRREVEPVLSSGVPNPVRLVLEPRRAVRGELRDLPPPGVATTGHRFRFALRGDEAAHQLRYLLTPPSRGDLSFGDVYVRLEGPLGLCARQLRLPLQAAVKVFPDLTALTRDALSLAHAEDARAGRRTPRRSDGSEFESLREYREGDDVRHIDWKSTARRGRAMVRVFEPEKNQAVLLMIDCGRHMAGKVGARRKLDHAVDAALRLAKVSLDQGDLVGLIAFGNRVHAHLPPRKGEEHLRTLTQGLYRIEATLEESDYGKAFDVAFARHHRRTLVVVFSDLLDPETSAALVTRTLALRPRHLPLLVSLLDEDLRRAATAPVDELQAAYLRQTAARIEDEHRLTTARLRNAGALVVREPATGFSAAAVNAYLSVKQRGAL